MNHRPMSFIEKLNDVGLNQTESLPQKNAMSYV
ncbi:hypothetical protein BC781_105113 [Sediminitomix flava]|uniref:Uncharacterized protein n=1 Tax=Sediminitomix flava TaxID=379075 RepID=A0A315Z8N1_SEDFL|nr:hypothetical protein BC781_105113 [Sediminitomix flava]